MVKYEEIIKDVNILLADDDEDYNAMTYAFLRQFGYKVDRAYNGKEALEMLKTNKYQIALLDYYMPELTGEEVVREIRKNNKEIIIILQTGFSGQKPPVETMQNLDVQNYYDKTEGIDRLNLELVSAIKIYAQQNEIELSNFRAKAIGNLISDVAQEIKSDLLSVSAGMEITNMYVNNSESRISQENIEKLSKYYGNNKNSLERIDRVLSSIINQSTENTDYILTDEDATDLIKLILNNRSKLTGTSVEVKTALKSSGYIKGSINDTIFIVCDIANSLMDLDNDKIEILLTDDEENWYFRITSENIKDLNISNLNVVKKVTNAMKDTFMEVENDLITISLRKI